MAAEVDIGSRNRPLSTALAPAGLVIVITMLPADRPVQVDARLERRDRLGVQHRAGGGVADLDLLAPALLSQSRKYSSRSCVWPSVRLTSTVKLVAEYQTAATRFGAAGTCRARGSVVVVVQV